MDELWLDSVLAVPAIGIQFKAPPSIGVRLRELAAPALDQLAALTDLEIMHTGTPVGPELRISGADGFTHKLVYREGTCHAAIEFSFSPTETKSVGKLPSMEYQLRSYSKLVDEARRRVEMLSSPLLRLPNVSIYRLGLAANAGLATSQLPPGFVRYKDWNERPWKRRGTVVKHQATMFMRFSAENGHQDQCHHNLGYEHGSDETEYRFVLDFQRLFSKPPAKTPDTATFLKKATSYFQEFAFPEPGVWE